MRVLVVGSGGREHALVWKISKSPLVSKIYCAPGNGGTAALAENISIEACDIDSLLAFASDRNIDLTVVGPEGPLVNGIVDRFESEGLNIFGPRKDLALLEGSKTFAKEIMDKYNVPTAGCEVFTDSAKAKEYLIDKNFPLVIKADGLAAGKGVMVCSSQQEAVDAIDLIMVEKKFQEAGEKVIIEEFLDGEEVSVLIFTDGRNIVPLVSSQDHKRAFDGDKGPNTGGMGAYSPAPIVSDAGFEEIIKKIFHPIVEGLRNEGRPYKGMLYGGIMIKDGKPFVLEFNVRFGDPETQAILPKLKSDLVSIMLKTIEGRLDQVKLHWDERVCVCVVLASRGYPGAYDKGKRIGGLEKLEGLEDIFVFHAGTKKNDCFLTNGGRVLNVVALGSTMKQAQDKVYKSIGDIDFVDMHYRNDIGNKALQGGSNG